MFYNGNGSIEDYAYDQTGYGPIGTGNAPTPQEIRIQQRNRFHTDRLSTAMQYIDPYVVGATQTAMQKLYGSNDQAAVRRATYSTAGGQAAMDMAMMARHAGLLGQGDPVNYATNIMRGIASGGFSARVSGTEPSGASIVGSNQRITGNGALAEQVALNYAKGMITDLYGTGIPDPSKLYGFNMEEASGVFRKIVSRGGVGRAASIEYGAPTQSRIDAARDQAVDPTIKEKLAGVRAASDEDLQKLIDVEGDDKFKAELVKIKQSNAALRVDSEGRKAVSNTVKEVTKGMAALSDMYGELNAPQLQAMLESISGTRITNRTQARKATAMVNELRNVAEASGNDPRAFMEYAQIRQAGMLNKVYAATGMDERSATTVKAINAELANSTLLDATYASKADTRAASTAEHTLGFEGAIGMVRTPEEMAADKEQGRLQYLAKRQGSVMLSGAVDNYMSEEDSATGKDLLRQIDEASAAGDFKAQDDLELQAQNLLTRAWGAKSWEAARQSGVAEKSTKAAYEGPNRERQERLALEGRNKSLLRGGINSQLETDWGMGAEEADTLSKQLVENIGMPGMTQLGLFAADSGLSTKDRLAQQKAELVKESGLSEEQADVVMKQLFTEEGKYKDKDKYEKLFKITQATDREGGAINTRRQRAQDYLDSFGENSARKRMMGNESGKVSLNKIVTSLATGSLKSLNDSESMGLAVQALADENVNLLLDERDADGNTIDEVDANGKATGKKKKIDLSKEFAANLDFSKGFTEERMADLAKLNQGKDIGLAKKMGYESNAELAAATKDDAEKRAQALRLLTTDEQFQNLHVAGPVDSMTVSTDRGLNTATHSQKEVEGRYKKLQALDALMPGMKDSERSVWKNRVLAGEELGLTEDMFKAGNYSGKQDNTKFDKFWNWGFNRGSDGTDNIYTRVENAKNFQTLSDTVQGADGTQMEGLVELNKDQSLVKQMEAQAKTYELALSEGTTHIQDKDPKTGKEITINVEESLAELKAATAKLREATNVANGMQAVGYMKVTTLKIDSVEDIKKQ